MKLPFKDKKFIFLLIAVIVVITLEIMSLSGWNIPMPYAPFVYATFILLIGYEVVWDGIKALFKLNFSSINLLMLIAAIGAFYLQEYPEAAVVIVLYVLGEALEDIGIDNSKSALNDLVDKAPKKAFLKDINDWALINEIPIGSTIVVKPGEMIPMDGTIISGNSSVNESAITGEFTPKDKKSGDAVFAGTLNQTGYIEFQTTELSEDTTFSKIIRLTFEAQAQRGKTQKFIQTFSKYYTPSVILLALLLFLIPVFVLQLPLNHWLLQAISLLVIACPCALVISTPVAIYAAIGNASGKGILVKGGKYIEEIAKIKALATDKTRTITYGTPEVIDVLTFNDTDIEELLACAAGAEVFSEHPLAQSIVDYSRKMGFEPHRAENFQSITGKGASAKCLVCEDETVLIGNLSFIESFEKIDEEVFSAVKQFSEEGKTCVVISFGKGVAGVIALSDQIKPESATAIRHLKEMDIDVAMLTGDNEATAQYIAQQSGITKVYSSLLPADKANIVEKLINTHQNVAMVGDGINDAPALAKSSVGIAMGVAGSDTAIETADVALMNDRLDNIPYLVKLGKKTLKQIKINTFGAILVKLFFVILAVTGHAHLVFAIAADVGVTLVVILLSLRILNYQPIFSQTE